MSIIPSPYSIHLRTHTHTHTHIYIYTYTHVFLSRAVRNTFLQAHWFIAAAMAEKATGMSWNQLFDERIKRPLGLGSSQELQFAQWTNAIGNRSGYRYERSIFPGYRFGFRLNTASANPAAGLLVTMNEMMTIMRIIGGRGTVDGVHIIDAQLIDTLLFTNNFPNAYAAPGEIYELAGRFGYRLGFGTVLFCGRDASTWLRESRCDSAGMISLTAIAPFFVSTQHNDNDDNVDNNDASYNAILSSTIRGSTYRVYIALEELRRAIAPAIAAGIATQNQ